MADIVAGMNENSPVIALRSVFTARLVSPQGRIREGCYSVAIFQWQYKWIIPAVALLFGMPTLDSFWFQIGVFKRIEIGQWLIGLGPWRVLLCVSLWFAIACLIITVGKAATVGLGLITHAVIRPRYVCVEKPDILPPAYVELVPEAAWALLTGRRIPKPPEGADQAHWHTFVVTLAAVEAAIVPGAPLYREPLLSLASSHGAAPESEPVVSGIIVPWKMIFSCGIFFILPITFVANDQVFTLDASPQLAACLAAVWLCLSETGLWSIFVRRVYAAPDSCTLLNWFGRRREVAGGGIAVVLVRSDYPPDADVLVIPTTPSGRAKPIRFRSWGPVGTGDGQHPGGLLHLLAAWSLDAETCHGLASSTNRACGG